MNTNSELDVRWIGPIYLLVFFCAFSLSAQINTERFRQDADSVGFAGHLDLAATISTGNTSYRQFLLGSRLNYNWGRDYTFLVADIGYIRDKDKKIFDHELFHLRNVVTVTRLIQQEMFVQYDFNKKRKLLSRKLVGAGLRFRILKRGALKFRTGVGYFYEIEDYDLPERSSHDKHTEAHRLNNYETLEIDLKKHLKLLSVTYIQPEIGRWRDVKIISENALIVDLGRHLELAIKVNLRYDSRPPDQTKELDTLSNFALAVKL